MCFENISLQCLPLSFGTHLITKRGPGSIVFIQVFICIQTVYVNSEGSCEFAHRIDSSIELFYFVIFAYEKRLQHWICAEIFQAFQNIVIRPRGYTTCLCTIHRDMKFILLINVKMQQL